MGNCVFRGFGGGFEEMNIKVVTSNGGIMELYSPITAECITNEFPGHRIFRTRNNNLFSQPQPQPLLHNEHLHPGQFYYLLPLTNTNTNSNSTTTFTTTTTTTTTTTLPQQEQADTFHVNNNINDNYTATCSSMVTTPYRMSFDNQRQGQGQGQGGRGRGTRSSEAEVFPRYNSTGVWKVKLVISPDQLSEILSHDSRTEALIESVRTVAKCANGVPHSSSSSSSSSVANSDHCSSLSVFVTGESSHTTKLYACDVLSASIPISVLQLQYIAAFATLIALAVGLVISKHPYRPFYNGFETIVNSKSCEYQSH